jgi:hypothetical protein
VARHLKVLSRIDQFSTIDLQNGKVAVEIIPDQDVFSIRGKHGARVYHGVPVERDKPKV